MSADITLVCVGVAITSFKQAFHLAVATAEYYDVVGIAEVGHMDVNSNLNPLDA